MIGRQFFLDIHGQQTYGIILLYKDMGIVILTLDKACIAVGALLMNLN